MKRLLVGFLAGIIVTLLAVGPVQGGARNCKPAWKCVPPTAAPTVVATVSPTAIRTSIPTVAPTVPSTPAPTALPTSSGYVFDDEFDGTTLSKYWEKIYTCCGVTVMDRTLGSVSGGYLHVPVVNRSGTWYSVVLDTKGSDSGSLRFTPTYGYFEARMLVPKGVGLWPGFWLYDDSASGHDEIDVMEVCDNPLGANGGNDASLLHTTVHSDPSGAQVGNGFRTADLTLGWHTYAVDWRPTYIAFYLDGAQVWRETSMLIATPKAVLLDIGLGGSWCGGPDASTPTSSEELVDWVHVRP